MQFMEEHRNFASIAVSAVLISALLLTGCVSLATDLGKVAFNETQKGFSLDKSPGFHEIIELKNVNVHIVGDRKHFTWDQAAAYGSPVAGYATQGNEIYVFGKRVKGKIVLNQTILGHALNHVLSFKNPQVTNPDELDDNGA